MVTPAILRVALDLFRKLPYPKKCRGRNVYGIELILLDADIYEAAEKIADGDRDPDTLNSLGSLELHAKMVLHALENDAYFYYDQARELARMVLDLAPVERGPVVRLVEAIIANDSPEPDMISSSTDVINARAFGHDTALMTAARLGREAWCKALLDAGADPSPDDGISWTPCALAAVSGQVTILRILLEAGVDPNRAYRYGNPPHWTPPLLWAIDYEHEAAVALLLEHGADPWIKHSNGRDPYEYAVIWKRTGIASLIAKARDQSAQQRKQSRTLEEHFSGIGDDLK